VARRDVGGYDPRQRWAAWLAPYVVAVREGATVAFRTARREREEERARALRQAMPLGQRVLVLTAAGVAAVGAVGAVTAALASRRPGGAEPEGRTATDQLRSTMEAGRERVTGMAREARQRVRGDEPAPAVTGGTPAGPETAYPSPEAASDRSRRGTAASR
jgi:hypothetical protein